MIGRTLSHYEITARLGAGAMGEVWRATDTTLDREIALKVLPEELAADPERLERFEREAKAIAALNHPNVVTIHSVEEADGVHLLTMELVEGRSLDRILPAGGFDLDRLFPLAIQIADAVAAAHEKAIVHRDLKPANVMVTDEGRVKVLDFGLAKLAVPDDEDEHEETQLMTRAGTLLGTVPYMSPEQVQGLPVDHRSDIFSIGVLLHEMATGQRPFRGDNAASVISAILKDRPPRVTELKADLPTHLARIVGRCLEKQPQRRYQSAREVQLELDELASELRLAASGSGTSPASEKAPDRRSTRSPATGRAPATSVARWALPVLALAVVALVTLWPSPPPPARHLVQSTLMPPPGWDFAAGSPFAVSRDGRGVAFVASSRQDNEEVEPGTTAIWIRDLSATEARRLVDADGWSFPFWSPDGRWIAFFDGRALSKISVDGGPVVPITDATEGRGGTWSEDGTIVFQPNYGEPLMSVPAGGGPTERVTTLDRARADLAHRWPHFLPDGRRFLFYVACTASPGTSEHSGLYVGSLDSSDTRFLMRSESRGELAGGHLFYREGSTLMARPIDLADLRFTGDPVPMATEVPGGAISWGGAHFSVSEADVLVHLRGVQASVGQLTWRDGSGTIVGTIDEPGAYQEPALSHDGGRLALAVGNPADIWIHDLTRESRTRLTVDPADDREPLWSPDDGRLAFSSARHAEGEIWVRATSGQGEAQLVYTAGVDVTLNDWSRDGRLILFSYHEPSDDSWDLWTLDLETSVARPLLTGPFEQAMASFSPDGEWLAYASDASGRAEIYVQRFPEADGRFMVSSESARRGAYSPAWRDDGLALYYYRAGSGVMTVPIRSGEELSFGTPRFVFHMDPVSGQGSNWVITDQGQRILSNELPPVDPSKAGARLILNWSTALRGPGGS